MNTIKTVFCAAFLAAALAPSASAGLADEFALCAAKYHVPPKVEGTVILECTAADGHLGDCTVKEAPDPKAAFSMAATCIAQRLPIGSKTGATTVPIKFTPQS